LIQPILHRLRRTVQRLFLLPILVERVKNWPTVLAARVGLRKIDAVRFRDGSNWHLLDVRPGFAALRDVYLERIYDARFQLDPGGTILDLGANIGMFTVLAAKKLVPEGRVFAVEPNPDVAAVLRRNLAENGISNVELIQAAAFTADGEAELQLASHSLGATISKKEHNARSVVVQTIKISRVVEAIGNVDLLKVDIEGAEWPIFFDSDPRMWKSIKRIAMEFHLDSAEGRTPADLAGHLSQLGYTNIRIDHPPGLYGYLWAELS
jgi:FkbM family methyltransferase